MPGSVNTVKTEKIIFQENQGNSIFSQVISNWFNFFLFIFFYKSANSRRPMDYSEITTEKKDTN